MPGHSLRLSQCCSGGNSFSHTLLYLVDHSNLLKVFQGDPDVLPQLTKKVSKWFHGKPLCHTWSCCNDPNRDDFCTASIIISSSRCLVIQVKIEMLDVLPISLFWFNVYLDGSSHQRFLIKSLRLSYVIGPVKKFMFGIKTQL